MRIYIYAGVSFIPYQGKWYRGPPVTYLQNGVLNNSRNYEKNRLHNCNGMFQIYNIASLNNLPIYQPSLFRLATAMMFRLATAIILRLATAIICRLATAIIFA